MKNIQDLVAETLSNLSTKVDGELTEFEELRVEGESGGGMVKITMNGLGTVLDVKIDPLLMSPDHRAHLQQLLIGAFNDGQSKQVAVTSQIGAKKLSQLGIDFFNFELGKKQD